MSKNKQQKPDLWTDLGLTPPSEVGWPDPLCVTFPMIIALMPPVTKVRAAGQECSSGLGLLFTPQSPRFTSPVLGHRE